jgi:hypothetical protein
MPKRRIFEATHPDGSTIRRSSDTMVYSHAVVFWRDAWKYQDTVVPAQWSKPQWQSRRDLAEKIANSERRAGRSRVEILDVREVTK